MTNYECTNCKIKFLTVNSYHAHALDCKLKYHNKPRYQIVEVEDEKDMPNRLHSRGHELVYNFLVQRDGEHCIHCKAVPAATGPPLEIDHANNDPNDWRPDNLHLACKPCNLFFRQLSAEEHVRLIEKDSASNESERNHTQVRSKTNLLKSAVNYSQGSAEMQVSGKCEVIFRDWVLKEIDQVGFMLKDDVLNGGAEYCGCSQITIERYLKKLTSYMGPLEYGMELNQTVVRRRKRN